MVDLRHNISIVKYKRSKYITQMTKIDSELKKQDPTICLSTKN